MPRAPCSIFAVSSRSAFVALAVLIGSSKKCRAVDVQWLSPAAGDVYGPGAFILGEWKSATEVVSPSFQLCIAGAGRPNVSTRDLDDLCGAAVQPTVQRDYNTGSYQVTVASPNVTETSDYYLELVDNTGSITASSVFSLSAVDPNMNSSSPVISRANVPVSGRDSAPSYKPFTGESHMPAPTAAYAVPLALAGTVVLVAGALGIHHHRKLVQERAAEKERLAQSANGGVRRGMMDSRASSTRSFASNEKAHMGEKERMAYEDRYTPVYIPRLVCSDRSRERDREQGRQPRETTRAPFVSGRATVPAGVFRSNVSPHVPMPHSPHRSSMTHTPQRTPVPRTPRREREDDAVTDAVMSHYLCPSPIPGTEGLTPTPLRKAHVRRSVSPSPSVHRLAPSPPSLYPSHSQTLYPASSPAMRPSQSQRFYEELSRRLSPHPSPC